MQRNVNSSIHHNRIELPHITLYCRLHYYECKHPSIKKFNQQTHLFVKDHHNPYMKNISFCYLIAISCGNTKKKKMRKKLTTFPVAAADIIMFESSPPLMINELFVELVTHSTPAVCSLENLSRKCIIIVIRLLGTWDNLQYTLIKSALC